MNAIRRWGWWLVFLLPVVILLTMAGGFIYLRGAEFSDLAISHLPNALWIQRSLSEWGQIPLWSNTILSGYPFAANPLSGLHYPPGWIALLFPLPLGLNLVMLLHLLLGGVGMYRLLRGEGLAALPAGLGMLAFEAQPKLIAHLGAGHVSLVYAVCWTPWLLLAERSSERRWWLPAVVLGLIALADPRWAAMAGILWVAYAARGAVIRAAASRRVWLWDWVCRGFGSGLLALVLSAALWLPLVEYTRLATRAEMQPGEALTFSLPPAQLLSLFAPSMGGTPEFALYAGGGVLVLATLGLGLAGVRRRAGFWYFTVLIALLLSLGAALPGAEVIASLPVVNLLRVPTRALFAGGMALAFCAAWTLQEIIQNPLTLRDLPRLNLLHLLLGLAFLLLCFAGLGWRVTGEFPLRFAWGGLAMLGAVFVLLLRRSARIGDPALGLLVIAWSCVDLCGSNLAGLQYHPAREEFERGSEILALLPSPEADSRIYSPSYSIPQQTAALRHLELADGVDPLQLSAYVQYMGPASGVLSSGYSVTLPAYASGDPQTDNRDARPDARLLGLLNVSAVASEFPLEAEGLVEVGRSGTTILYRNEFVMPRAWVQPPGEPAGSGASTPAEVTWSPNHITIQARGPGRLILSELAYPGWRARVDGLPARLETAVIFRAVDLSAGKHTVDMDFRPTSAFAGAGMSAAAWLAVALLWLGNRVRRK